MEQELESAEALDRDAAILQLRRIGHAVVRIGEQGLHLLKPGRLAVGIKQDALEPVLLHDRSLSQEFDMAPACDRLGEAGLHGRQAVLIGRGAELAGLRNQRRRLLVKILVGRPNITIHGIRHDLLGFRVIERRCRLREKGERKQRCQPDE